MAQRNSHHTVTLKIPADTVDLGGGFFLPAGNYSADITMMHIPMRGQVIDQLGSAKVTVSAQFLLDIGMPPAGNSAISYGIDVTKYVMNGSAVQV